MRCCICEKEFTDGLKDSGGNLYCSKECYNKSLPHCYVCNKTIEHFYEANGKKYCSQECLQYAEPINKAVDTIIKYRMKCLKYLPISDKSRSILKKYINPDELFKDAIAIAQEKNIVSSSDIATSIAMGMKLTTVSTVSNEKEPGITSSATDLKIYGYKLASEKARMQYTESLLNLIFDYENVKNVIDNKIINFMQIDSKNQELRALKEKLKTQRNELFKGFAKKASMSDSDISTVIAGSPVALIENQMIKGVVANATKSFLASNTKAAFPIVEEAVTTAGGAIATSVFLPLAGLLAVGGALSYLFNRKNRIIAEGIAEGQSMYLSKLADVNKAFNECMETIDVENAKMESYIQDLKKEIVKNEIEIAQFKLDISMLNEMKKLD